MNDISSLMNAARVGSLDRATSRAAGSLNDFNIKLLLNWPNALLIIILASFMAEVP